MDITFHYFAVKTLAIKAGFNEDYAQRIASYSQYIDDFNWIVYKDCKNLPEYIKKSDKYDLYVSNPLTLNFNFNPPTSGFDTVDFAWLISPGAQKYCVSPFHFIPPTISSDKKYSEEVRTIPAKPEDGSIISNMVKEAISEYKNANTVGKALMKIGMLLHTFADTYAHQFFSGYSKWVNDVKVTQVIDNITNADITQSMLSEIYLHTQNLEQYNSDSGEEAGIMPGIGHMWAYHVPDLTNVSFKMLYKEDENSSRSKIYERNNTETFVETCRHILNILRDCLGKGDISEAEWTPIANNLKKGFLFKFPSRDIEKTLANHWGSIFNDIKYSYSKKKIEQNFYPHNEIAAESGSAFGTNYSQEFYDYTCLADEHLIYMYGDKPRK